MKRMYCLKNASKDLIIFYSFSEIGKRLALRDRKHIPALKHSRLVDCFQAKPNEITLNVIYHHGNPIATNYKTKV